MNLLIEKAPDFIQVGGKKIKINTDFSVWVEFLVAGTDKDNERIEKIMRKIFVDEIPSDAEETITACFNWLFPPENSRREVGRGFKGSSNTAFDFNIDGNVIYCELWEYFPELMKRGITFHEGMELIKLLMHNDSTMLWHRAFARCGDFSKMDKERKKYWSEQRAIWAIPCTEKNIDDVFSAAF